MTPELAISIIAALIAIYAVIVSRQQAAESRRLTEENNTIQNRLVELEEQRDVEAERTAKKANLRASIQKSSQHSYRLVIENTGKCVARNIMLQLDGVPFTEHEISRNNTSMVNLIGAYSSATMLMAIHLNCAPPFELEITWEDDSSELGHYGTTLTF